MVELPLSVTEDGRVWHLYSFEWKGAEGPFTSQFYAISDEHAQLIIDDIKDSARLVGRVDGIIRVQPI